MPVDQPADREFAERLLLTQAVTQDRLGMPFGNCLEACYATLLGIPLEDVPDPRQDCAWDGTGEGPKAHSSAGRCGVNEIDNRSPWLADWLAGSFGLAAVCGVGPHPPGVMLRKTQIPLFWIASGKSERGLGHAVVFSNGKLIWDPHPDRTGILKVDGWTVLCPLGPIGDRLLRGYLVPVGGVRRRGVAG